MGTGLDCPEKNAAYPIEEKGEDGGVLEGGVRGGSLAIPTRRLLPPALCEVNSGNDPCRLTPPENDAGDCDGDGDGDGDDDWAEEVESGGEEPVMTA